MLSLSILATTLQAVAVFARPTRHQNLQGFGGVDPYWKYETVTGYFKQDEELTNPLTFDTKINNFGLKPIANKRANETDWQAFERIVDDLNHKAERTDAVSVYYKVLYISRVGQGLHEEALQSLTPAGYYLSTGRLDKFVDAGLSKLGRHQAQELSDAWAKQLAVQHTPAPQSYHVSSMQRAMQTARITFGNLTLPADRPFKPVIRDALRPRFDMTRATQRHKKTWIAHLFPEFKFEDNFSEKDKLWHSWFPEIHPYHTFRVQKSFDYIFDTDKNTWLSITTHRKTVNAIMEVIGHRKWEQEVFGDIVPVLVKATRKDPTLTGNV